MLLSINSIGEKIYFVWQGENFRRDGYLSNDPALFSALKRWLEAYKQFCVFSRSPLRIIVKKEDKKFNTLFGELTEKLDSWLRSSVDFWESDRKAIEQGDRALTLIIDPKSDLALLPWEYCFLGRDYSLSYASPHFSPEGSTPERAGILAILGDMGEADRPLLEKHEAEILEKPDIDTLCQALRNGTQEIIYYGGHCDGEKWYLSEAIAGDKFKNAVAQGAKVLIANSCRGTGFIWLDLPLQAFIIWKVPVPDRVARDFAEFYFQSLATEGYLASFYKARTRVEDKWHERYNGVGSFVQLWKRPVQSPVTSDALSLPKSHQSPVWGFVRTLSRVTRLKKAIPVAIAVLGLILLSWEFYLKIQTSQWILQQSAESYREAKINLIVAKRLFQFAKNINGENARAYYNLGEIEERLGNTSKAIEYYQESANLGFPDAFISLARLQLTRKQYQKAIDSASFCIALLDNIDYSWDKETRTLCYTRKAQGFYGLGNLKLARKNIENALELIEGEKDAYFFDAYCFAFKIDFGLGNQEKAGQWSKTVLVLEDKVNDFKQIKSDCVRDAQLFNHRNGNRENI